MLSNPWGSDPTIIAAAGRSAHLPDGHLSRAKWASLYARWLCLGSELPRTPSRNCLKRGSEGLARYPTEHEKSISDRPLRCRMEMPRILPSRSQSQRASSDLCSARDPRRHLLRAKERLCLATLATRLPALEDGLPLLPLLALGRDVGKDARRLAPEDASPPQEKPSAQCRHSG